MAATVAQPNPVPGIGQECSLKSRANVENVTATSQDNGDQGKVPSRHQQLSPGDFTLPVPVTADHPVMRAGTFARVCLVRPASGADEDREKVFALKILRKAEVIKLKQIDHVRHERQILGDVAGHPFITELIASFSDHDSLYMLLDYVPGGELFSYLRRHRRFPEEWARFYASEIVLVLEYLHEQQGGVAYRDLKPENLLLDAEGHVKLVDFGFAKRLGHRNDRPVETYTLCGTPEYLAPEVIQNKGHTTAVDWILEKPVLFPAEPIVSPNARDIIRALCTVDRSQRLGNISGGTRPVKSHPFFYGVDWDALFHRRVRPPIQPHVRFPGDAQCFDVYPEDDGKREPYTEELASRYDHYFEGF
ncbi:hypothetical protein DL770_005126 [Monosporascus sp. CRB-9-2]|nr:hypothetical protein DL770_005126 [Monosporascus sp. CRB-9-2]